MKPVECTYKDHRQEIWTIGKRRVSIVDLRQPLLVGTYVVEVVRRIYASHPYEVADVTDEQPEVLGRFKTDAQALNFSKEYVSKQVFLLREATHGQDTSSNQDKN